MSGTGERVVVEQYRSTPEEYLIYLFHTASYRFAEPYTKGREVLDYGCGSGYGSAAIAAEATRVVGVDVSEEAVEHARANFSAPRLEFAPIEADRPLPFPDGSFDTVLSFQVIEHVRDPAAYLSEIRRVLRPGGHLVLTTPERRTRLLPTQRPWNRWHLTEYSERTMGRTLAPHFSDVELLGMTGKQEVLELELRRTRRAKWLMLPATLPLIPDRWRIRLLEVVQRLREARGGGATDEPRDYDFDESALSIGPDAWPSVNIVAVARR
jgi:SAM-dependent methyltransferase